MPARKCRPLPVLARTGVRRAIALCALVVWAATPGRGLHAQDGPAKRLANIVWASVSEYAKGIDSAGHLISQAEYQEAVTFLADARESAARLSGDRADSARTRLEALAALMGRRVAPGALAPLVKQIMESLGADAALDLPTRPVDLAAGKRLYEMQCAACHGPRGMGDGPDAAAAARVATPPAALGSATAMRDRTPAMMFRIMSVGVAGTAMKGFGSTLTADERWDVVSYIGTLRAPGPIAEGQGLYVQRCAACHGPTGGSNGVMSPALSRVPAELSSFTWQVEHSDSQIALIVKEGSPGTAMPPARDLAGADVDKIVAYVRTLSLRDAAASPAIAASPDSPTAESRRVLDLLNQSMAAARAGHRDEAADRAFDAYLAFEPLETPARARDPGLVNSLERHFGDFRGAVKANDLRLADRARNAIEEGMPAVLALGESSTGGFGAFLQSLLIIVREGFEAILVIGAIVAFLIKTGHRERLKSIWFGVLSAAGASLLTAVVLATVLRAIPASREIIEGVTMLVAVGVLFSVSYWLISRVEAARWQQFIREKVSAALEGGGGKTLAFVAFLAVFREGAETALFYQALFQETAGHGVAIALGLVVGGAALVVIFTLFHRYGVRIPLRPFFAVTSALLYYLAFVFMGKGVHELQEGNLIGITVLPGWPHVDAMGIFPTVETLLAQSLLVALFVFALLKTFWPRRAVALPTVPPGAAGEPAAALADQVDSLAARVDRLQRRVENVEQAVDSAERGSGLTR